jgi:hypothetical protein
VNFTARVASRAFEGSRVTPIVRSVRIAMLGPTSMALTAAFLFPASVPAAAEPPLTVAEAKELIKQYKTTPPGSTSSTPVSGSRSRTAGRNSASGSPASKPRPKSLNG